MRAAAGRARSHMPRTALSFFSPSFFFSLVFFSPTFFFSVFLTQVMTVQRVATRRVLAKLRLPSSMPPLLPFHLLGILATSVPLRRIQLTIHKTNGLKDRSRREGGRDDGRRERGMANPRNITLMESEERLAKVQDKYWSEYILRPSF